MASISKSLFESVVLSVLDKRFPEIETLSDEQSAALFALVNREDVFAILPTGHGKSLIFQCLPDICEELSLRGRDYPRKAVILVVCPLNSLVNTHIRELHSREITATSLVGDVDEEKVLRGEFSFVFANPESLILNEKWRKMLQSDVYLNNLFAIVTDEAHVIPKWGYRTQKYGTSSKKEFVSAFRECFSRLGELRSLLSTKPLVPVLALTATANIQTRNVINESLCLRQNYVPVFVSPNRENILSTG
ncbi:ATP-dependent DNA helicase Q-like SIM [Exaiptasia diaphana]|uniref:Helicase ATP-binding domain-containing protein n=1 Tax=Exaiptasia diaphana TaxID=2652724 RepID=A0A913Y565_EXADI|nr:ATP-dependent DNA helicase Q-like SIM [Exaiptasia diaphana]KXJ06971.1 ATP-dependent DNA helicase RecQ [Exaiptasia diaphana]